jgi:hypothetical protein
MNYANGEKYEGEWHEGKPFLKYSSLKQCFLGVIHGRGTYKYSDGGFYDGNLIFLKL